MKRTALCGQVFGKQTANFSEVDVLPAIGHNPMVSVLRRSGDYRAPILSRLYGIEKKRPQVNCY